MNTRYTLIALCILLTSCLVQEDLNPSDYEFRGNWDSPKYAMQIFMNGSATLNIRNRGSLRGYVKIEHNYMTFWSDNESDNLTYKRFYINQRPTTDSNGVTYMILNGNQLVKQ